MRRCTLVICIFVVWIVECMEPFGVAIAQQPIGQRGSFYVFGFGGDAPPIECAEYSVTLRRPDNGGWEGLILAWVQGFLSGRNVAAWRAGAVQKNITAMPPNQEWNDLQVYCVEHPNRLFVGAAAHLYDDLLPALPQTGTDQGAYYAGPGILNCRPYAHYDDVNPDETAKHATFYAQLFNQYFLSEGWTNGFISGRNVAAWLAGVPEQQKGSGQGGVWTIGRVRTFIANYCKQHPDQRLMDAVLDLYDKMP